jgi:hypothetical protein
MFARLLATEKAYMSQPAPSNSLETAFAHCQNLLLGQPELALEQALAILEGSLCWRRAPAHGANDPST